MAGLKYVRLSDFFESLLKLYKYKISGGFMFIVQCEHENVPKREL